MAVLRGTVAKRDQHHSGRGSHNCSSTDQGSTYSNEDFGRVGGDIARSCEVSGAREAGEREPIILLGPDGAIIALWGRCS